MPGPKPNKLHDELDALLDGRPVELTDELAPLVETADALRAELATFQLDPEMADRHLERVLRGPGTVVTMPVRQPSGWDVRRRVAAVVLAAALVLAPATMASAAALPGQAMYPFKLAIEQLRLASVQWSPAREAGERTRVADVRLEEVESLIRLQMFNQLPNALKAFNRAVLAAQDAVAEAGEQGEPIQDVARKLAGVRAGGMQMVDEVETAARNASVPISDSTLDAIHEAVDQSKNVLPQPPDPTPNEATPTPNTKPAPTTSPTTQATDPTTAPPTQPTDTTAPPTTAPPTTAPPTTAPPTTAPPTTAPPPTEDTNPAVDDQPAGGNAIVGESDDGGYRAPDVPPTTLGP
jgi:hypothetical protein